MSEEGEKAVSFLYLQIWLHAKAGLLTMHPLLATQIEWANKQFHFDRFLEAKPNAVAEIKQQYKSLASMHQ